MKCISLWQPWATLWVMGLKINETRHWSTNVRGEVAVHAALKWNKDLEKLCLDDTYFRNALKGIELPRGGIVGTVTISGCLQITERNAPRWPERAFGDYGLGRFMWPTSARRMFKTPIPFRGAQGFFNVPDELIPADESPRACACVTSAFPASLF